MTPLTRAEQQVELEVDFYERIHKELSHYASKVACKVLRDCLRAAALRASAPPETTTDGEPLLNNGINLRVIQAAYGWDYHSETGEVYGLTAGDHGYEPTGIVIESLIDQAKGTP